MRYASGKLHWERNFRSRIKDDFVLSSRKKAKGTKACSPDHRGKRACSFTAKFLHDLFSKREAGGGLVEAEECRFF